MRDHNKQNKPMGLRAAALAGTTALITGAALLLSLPALADVAVATPSAAPVKMTNSHDPVTPDVMKAAAQRYILSQSAGEASNDLTQASPANPMMAAPLNSPLASATPLARAALDHGAALYAVSPLTRAATSTTGQAVATVCPNTYEAMSNASNALLGPAYDAISKRDIASLQAQLPALQAQFNTIPLKAVAPEICNDHVNIYTMPQFFKLNVLKDAGAPTGLPANLPLVKQPDLPLTALAYAVGWTKYELKDFDGAFLANAKGLIIDPSDASLAQEYLADLMELKRYTDVVGFAETFLTNNYGLSDEQRSKFFKAHGIGLLYLGYGDAAEKSLMIALFYNPGDKELIDIINIIRTNKAKAGKS